MTVIGSHSAHRQVPMAPSCATVPALSRGSGLSTSIRAVVSTLARECQFRWPERPELESLSVPAGHWPAERPVLLDTTGADHLWGMGTGFFPEIDSPEHRAAPGEAGASQDWLRREAARSERLPLGQGPWVGAHPAFWAQLDPPFLGTRPSAVAPGMKRDLLPSLSVTCIFQCASGVAFCLCDSSRCATIS